MRPKNSKNPPDGSLCKAQRNTQGLHFPKTKTAIGLSTFLYAARKECNDLSKSPTPEKF